MDSLFLFNDLREIQTEFAFQLNGPFEIQTEFINTFSDLEDASSSISGPFFSV